MKFLPAAITYFCITRIAARFSGVIEEVEETDENPDEILDDVPVTDEVMEPNIKIGNTADLEEADDVPDPGWDKNEAIRDVAYFIRAHKFRDYDRRYYKNVSEAPRRLYESFPRPSLRSLHWEVLKHCSVSFDECLRYLERIVSLTPLRRQDDTITVMRQQRWTLPNHTEQILATEKDCQMAKRRDERTVAPFQGPIERFQWRTSVSYFMCWYTMLGVPELALFGEPCDNHANCLDKYGANNRDPRADDAKPYACALYSFCPDHCCPAKHIWYTKDCFQSPENPCYEGNQPADRKCILNRDDNQSLESLVLNQINVTCHCREPGYEWSSRFGLCVDVNECVTRKDNCSADEAQTCVNLPGYYDCICRLGYVYSPQERRCVASPTIEKALESVERKGVDDKPRSIFAAIMRMITKSGAHRVAHRVRVLCLPLFVISPVCISAMRIDAPVKYSTSVQQEATTESDAFRTPIFSRRLNVMANR